jgi:hypothetical protein
VAIVHTGLGLTLQWSERSGAMAVSTVLDGTARADTLATGRTVRGWTEGDAVFLEVLKTVSLPGGDVAQVRTVEKLSRHADGTLALERTIESGGASRTWRFVYQPAK